MPAPCLAWMWMAPMATEVELSDRVLDHLRDVAAWPELADDRYTDLRTIGTGGMGRVFAARDTRLGRDVALKVSHAMHAGARLDVRLGREASVLARLEHPGIVPVHDIGHLADGRLFYVMKLVDGQTLESRRNTLESEGARLAVFERLVETVAFAHAQGISHRDLSPANVMIGRFGEVLVMDWGIATSEAEAASREGGTRAGTPGFMAPEQSGGAAGAAGPACDVYALGAIFAWMTPEGTRVPRRLRAIMRKCLQGAPEARYKDAQALAADVARYRAGEAVAALPENFLERGLRLASRHLPLLLLIAAYLLMRILVAWWQGRA